MRRPEPDFRLHPEQYVVERPRHVEVTGMPAPSNEPFGREARRTLTAHMYERRRKAEEPFGRCANVRRHPRNAPERDEDRAAS